MDRAGIERLQREKLARMLPAVLPTNGFYGQKLQDVSFDARCDPLDRLPFTTRAELQEDQLHTPPYGSNLTVPLDHYIRIHQTSGSTGAPLRWLDTAESWAWWKKCWGIIYRGAGVTVQDRLFFPFSFGPFIGFWGAFEGGVSLGNFTIPAGGMTSSARLRHMLDHRATVVCCTPTYALRLAEVALEDKLDLVDAPVRLLIVAGEPGGNIPATRHRIESAWGARVIDHPGMTEMGPWGFECVEAPGGVHVIDSEFVPEVIDPKRLNLVGDGEIGELVLTNLGRWASPLIRYRTGDLVRLTRGRCACGRWFTRLEGGILGRVDDMLVIRGNNVFPSAVENVLRDIPEIVEFTLAAEQNGALTDLRIDVEASAEAVPDRLAEDVVKKIKDRLHFTPRVTVLSPGSLPRYELKAKHLIRRQGRRPHSRDCTSDPSSG